MNAGNTLCKKLYLGCLTMFRKHLWKASKLRRFSVYQNYIKTAHWNDEDFWSIKIPSKEIRQNDVDFWSIKITTKKCVKMTWNLLIFGLRRIYIMLRSSQRPIDIHLTETFLIISFSSPSKTQLPSKNFI